MPCDAHIRRDAMNVFIFISTLTWVCRLEVSFDGKFRLTFTLIKSSSTLDLSASRSVESPILVLLPFSSLTIYHTLIPTFFFLFSLFFLCSVPPSITFRSILQPITTGTNQSINQSSKTLRSFLFLTSKITSSCISVYLSLFRFCLVCFFTKELFGLRFLRNEDAVNQIIT